MYDKPESLAALYRLWERVKTVRVSTDQRLSEQFCFLVSAHLVADAVGAATAVIYNGYQTDPEKVIDLGCPVSGNDSFSPCLPVPCPKGLYVDVGSNVTSVVISYIEVR